MQALALLVALAWPAAAARAEYVPCKHGLFRCGNLGDQDGSAGGTQSNRYEAADGGESSGEEEEEDDQGEPKIQLPTSAPPPAGAAPPTFRATRAAPAAKSLPGSSFHALSQAANVQLSTPSGGGATETDAKSAVSGPAGVVYCSWSYSGFSPPPPLPASACTQGNENQTSSYGSHGTYTCACPQGASGPGPGPGPTPTPSVPGPGPRNPNSGSNCAPAEVFTAGDREWPIEGALFPVSQPGFTASGDSGTSIRFVADAGKYPLGMLIHIVDQKSQPSGKEVTVSACAHDFTPSLAACSTVAGATGTLAVRFGQGSVTALVDCPFVAGQTYYLNVRDVNVPRGMVSTQFWWHRRTDP